MFTGDANICSTTTPTRAQKSYPPGWAKCFVLLHENKRPGHDPDIKDPDP